MYVIHAYILYSESSHRLTFWNGSASNRFFVCVSEASCVAICAGVFLFLFFVFDCRGYIGVSNMLKSVSVMTVVLE